ncbi:MAG: OmpA family protein [Muribaculaceae bacterium]|nr:OmpA family protein [Muribaculaceae bacterium]
MKSKGLLSSLFLGVFALVSVKSQAQDTAVSKDLTVVECKNYVSSSWRNNWFLQLGAGANLPFVESSVSAQNEEAGKTPKHEPALTLNVAVGHWFSPYLAVRLSALGGDMKWENLGKSDSRYATLNADLMWDMFNSIGGVNTKRVFSIVPFVGVGGMYEWNMKSPGLNIVGSDGKLRTNTWAVPVSAGIQLRFRLCKYVDLFAEGRLQAYGDNFNNYAYGDPIDLNVSAVGGLTFNFGGKKFDTVNPCDYLSYINTLNNQVNTLRGDLAATAAALAAAEAQLPCPEVVAVECQEKVITPILASVRFNLNSAKIADKELVNVYNVAEWMKTNPDVKLVVSGYADKETGTNAYNMKLSQRRVDAVIEALVKYGVSRDRLVGNAQGDLQQPYTKDNYKWNRIVLFDAQ